jgi:predicted DNA-binding transcriptional regulator AlpA
MEYEQQTKSRFMTAQDVADEIGISKSRAYILIRDLNKELAKKGYYTIAGKIPRKYFEEKLYC